MTLFLSFPFFFFFFFFSLTANLSLHTEKSALKDLGIDLKTVDYHKYKMHRKIRHCLFSSFLQFFSVGMLLIRFGCDQRNIQ